MDFNSSHQFFMEVFFNSWFLFQPRVTNVFKNCLSLEYIFFQNHSTADSNSQEDDSTNNACCSQPSLILMCLMYSCVSRIVCILHSGLIPIWQKVKFRKAAFFASKWLKIYIFVMFFNTQGSEKALFFVFYPYHVLPRIQQWNIIIRIRYR